MTEKGQLQIKGVKAKKFFNNRQRRKQRLKPWLKPQSKNYRIQNVHDLGPKGKLYRQCRLNVLTAYSKRNVKNILNRRVLPYTTWQKLRVNRKNLSLRRQRRWLSTKSFKPLSWSQILTSAARSVLPTSSKRKIIPTTLTTAFGLVWPGRRNRRIWFGAYRYSLKWNRLFKSRYVKKWSRDEVPIWAVKRLSASNSLGSVNQYFNVINQKRLSYRSTKIYWRWIRNDDKSKLDWRIGRRLEHLKSVDHEDENHEKYNPIYDQELSLNKLDQAEKFQELKQRLSLDKRHRLRVRKRWGGQQRIDKKLHDLKWELKGSVQVARRVNDLSTFVALKNSKLSPKWKLRHSFACWLVQKASWRKRPSLSNKRRWFNRRRGEKFDPEVTLVWRNGVETRCITKFGNRKIYRPVKRKFPKWWKLPMGNKSMKRRRRNKKIFAFRWLNRTRHHMLSRIIRRRKFYSRRKRLNDFRYWKLNSPARLINHALKRCDSANDLFQQLVPLRMAMKSPQLRVRRSHRLNILANLWRYRQHKWFARGRARLAKVRLASIQPVGHWYKATPKAISFMHLPQIKRYRRRYRPINFQIDKRVSFNKVSAKSVEKSLIAWRSAGIEYKNRLHTFGTKHFSSFWKRGI